ncbi:MAG: 1-acyl-sn-glycerol-3-phosphate acyltransferase, partial [Succinivibrionaceae bacterium]|nr:1-acyl-sn-glycerol-3-phosphate acyltransferase [Succinivibrionaceae bacterium]
MAASSSLSGFNPTSSDDPVFDDIRPCRDQEVQGELRKIFSNKKVLDGILRFWHPWLLSSGLGPLLRPLVKVYLNKKYGRFSTIEEFQLVVADFMRHVMRCTTDGVTFKGFSDLDPGKAYLFISNHRDISLDPAFIDMALYDSHLETVRIA